MPAQDLSGGELRGQFLELLPMLSSASDRLLLASSLQLSQSRGWPSWLLLRRVKLTYRCRIISQGDSFRFLIWNAPASVRELLTTDVTLDLEPAPPKSPSLAYAQPVASLAYPTLVLVNPTADQRRDYLPPNHDPGRSLLFQLESDEFFGFGIRPGASPEAERIVARWSHGLAFTELGAGKDSPWDFEPLFRFAQALGRETSSTGEIRPWPSPLPDGALWTLAADALATPGQASAALERGNHVPPPSDLPKDQYELRTEWSLGRFHAKVVPLLVESGELADAESDDSFTAPFEVLAETAGGLRAEVRFSLPDFIVQGGLRETLLTAFRGESVDEDGQSLFRRAVARTREAAEAARIPWETALHWLRAEGSQTVILRVDRRERSDGILLLASGTYESTENGFFVWADEVTWTENGKLEEIEIETSGGSEAADLNLHWKSGKRAFSDFLHGLLRWRRIVLPQ